MSSVGTINSLLSNSNHMDIISNNIANASTMGFKSSSPAFYNIVPYSLYSRNFSSSGVGISGIFQNFSNGMLIETDNDLDLGITKDGFFRVLDSQGNIHYTRNGQFLLDKEKNIINMQGMYLTGWNKYFSKNNSYDMYNLEPINLKHADILKAKPTSTITLSAILNRNNTFFGNEKKNLNENLFNDYTITIYDKDEKEDQINISFRAKDKNTWIVDVKSNDPLDEDINNSFDLKFNSDGQLTSIPKLKIKTKKSKYDNLNLDLTGTVEDSNNLSDIFHKNFFHDGYQKGELRRFEILSNGNISATYSNKQKKEIGQIVLSKFINPEKLQPESGNTWSITENSGEESIGIAGHSGFGTLTSKMLEASNVDLNKELINMIIAQRNYQSNAQAFKTEDKIINTLINLK